MHRKVRRVSMWLSGIAMLVAGTLFVFPGTKGHAETTSGADAEAVAAAGATTPFATVEAETGTRGGGAALRSLTPGAAAPTAASLETEASGYSLVELKATGDSLTLPNNTGKAANTLVVRVSIPDAAAGGGITASLNLYVNGVYRQAISLSSKQAWNYRDATTNPDDPNAGGSPIGR